MTRASKNLNRIRTSRIDGGIHDKRFAGGRQPSTAHHGYRSQFRNRVPRRCVTFCRRASLMSEHVCPWWIGYFLVSPLRRWMQNPDEVIAPYVTPGMTVLEPGPGMGFFTLPLAQMVGRSGHVIAVDLQPKMISSLKHRAQKAELLDQIDARIASANSLGIDDLKARVDLTMAFAMVH